MYPNTMLKVPSGVPFPAFEYRCHGLTSAELVLAVTAVNTWYGPAWLTPTAFQEARLFKFSGILTS